MNGLPEFYKLSKEVVAAQRQGGPVVALESAVITHGLPRPQNLEAARSLEEIVRAEGAAPATIGVLEGRLLVGMEAADLETLANHTAPRKLSSRDLAAAIEAKASGGTTVASTLRVAANLGISVFATGGIGGVHRGRDMDVSADLPELASQPLIVVCAGAKSILDLPATLEQLETLGVPVIGYQTDEFPAFYARESGLSLNARVETAKEAADLARRHWELGGRGLLLAAPLPTEHAIPLKDLEAWTEQAQAEADAASVSGQPLTPFLLSRVAELSQGQTLAANLALLQNNARLAAQIAAALKPRGKPGLGLIQPA
jgi:pseudouridine-5'-phosphate glycosidase